MKWIIAGGRVNGPSMGFGFILSPFFKGKPLEMVGDCDGKVLQSCLHAEALDTRTYLMQSHTFSLWHPGDIRRVNRDYKTCCCILLSFARFR